MSMKKGRYRVIRAKVGHVIIDRVLRSWTVANGSRVLDYGRIGESSNYRRYLPGRVAG